MCSTLLLVHPRFCCQHWNIHSPPVWNQLYLYPDYFPLMEIKETFRKFPSGLSLDTKQSQSRLAPPTTLWEPLLKQVLRRVCKIPVWLKQYQWFAQQIYTEAGTFLNKILNIWEQYQLRSIEKVQCAHFKLQSRILQIKCLYHFNSKLCYILIKLPANTGVVTASSSLTFVFFVSNYKQESSTFLLKITSVMYPFTAEALSPLI